MLHKLARLFRRWNERLRENPAAFIDPRFGSVETVSVKQAEYLMALAKEDDLRIAFDEHGAARRGADPSDPAPFVTPPPTPKEPV